MKIIILCCTIFIIFGCNKEVSTPNTPIPKVTFSVDSVLNPSGTQSITLDNNGYYHLPIDNSKFQTLARITGKFLVDGKPMQIPSAVVGRISWESDHYWLLNAGDTTAQIIYTYFNYYQNKLVTASLGYMKAQSNQLIPTINSASYPDTNDGSVNTMFAPV